MGAKKRFVIYRKVHISWKCCSNRKNNNVYQKDLFQYPIHPEKGGF